MAGAAAGSDELTAIAPRHIAILFRRRVNYGNDVTRRTFAISRREASRTCWSAPSRFIIARRWKRFGPLAPQSSIPMMNSPCSRP